tara:strand:+ start:1581 stop:1808 length:228 start_codon:yes stop_codon:yes gene_type:complete
MNLSLKPYNGTLAGCLIYNSIEMKPDGIIISMDTCMVNNELFCYYYIHSSEDKNLNFWVREDILLESGIWKVLEA